MGAGDLGKHKFVVAASGCLVLALVFALAGRNAAPGDPAVEPAASSGGVSILPADPASFHELRASANARAAMGSTSPDSGQMVFHWSVNGDDVHTGPTLDPMHFGPDDTVTLRVERGGPGSPETVGQAQVRIRNSAPEIRVVNLQRDRQDPQTLTALVDARDADGDLLELTYLWEIDGRPARVEGDRFPARDLEPGQSITVSVVADDGRAASEAHRSPTFTLDNRPPRVSVPQPGTVRTLEDGSRRVSFTMETADPDGDALRVEFPKAPAGLTWDAATGTVSWPLAAEVTEGSVVARVTDTHGASVERDLSFRL